MHVPPRPGLAATSFRRFFLIAFTVLGFGTTRELAADTDLNIPGYRVQWYDEFEGAAVDTTKWLVNEGVNATYRLPNGKWVEPQWFNEDITGWTDVGFINSEEQYYSPDNVSVNSGILEIEARLETVNHPYGAYNPAYHRYTSGKLNTAPKFQFTFGIVKWSAQLPAGNGMWPALWMLNNPQPDWYWDDEVDVMEARGSQPFTTTSAHHFKDANRNPLPYNSESLTTETNLQTSFNEFGLEWDASRLRTTLNGAQVFEDFERVPQGSMFLIMNAAVGGFFDPADVDDTALAAGTTFSIDWVRVWQPAAKPSDLSNGGFEDFQGPQWADWNTADDGNVSPTASPALHGSSSVRVSRLNDPSVSSDASNLFDGGNVGAWSGWLNETAPGGATTGGPIDPTTVPAVVAGNTAVVSVHKTSAAASANAVIYRQLPGSDLLGLDLTYTGTVVIEKAFAAGSTAIAFIRVFEPDYRSFDDYTATVTSGGDFTVQATIPASDVEAVQIGFETTGEPGSAGRLAARDLFLANDAEVVPVFENRTGFVQTVIAAPGQVVRYGVLAANDPLDPLSPAAEGRLILEFLDQTEGVLQTASTIIADSTSPTSAQPYRSEATAPGGTAFARLSLQRVTTDETTDTGGAFFADAAFLQVSGDTELPWFSTLPPSTLSVDAGSGVTLPIAVSSPSGLTYQWYFEGTPLSTVEDYAFTATPGSSGRYLVVAENAAGPVIGGWTDLTVATPDSDADRLIDYDESFLHGTDPSKADTDGDGSDDYEEVVILLTNPLDPDDRFAVTAIAMEGEIVEITIDSIAGVTYRVEASAELETWQSIGTPQVAIGGTTVLSASVPTTTPPLRYFRVVVDEP